MSSRLERLSKAAFYLSSIVIGLGGAVLYGALAYRSNLPPIPQMRQAYIMAKEVLAPSDSVLETSEVVHEDAVSLLLPDAVAPGLVLVAGNVAKRRTAVRIIDRQGRIIHEWRPIWSEIWPSDEGDFPARPVSDMYLHGVELLDDGSLVANFEHQSTFRLDPCGEVIWKLDNLGHHLVHAADDGTIWVSAEDWISRGETGYPNHRSPLRSWKLQNIDRDGTVLETISVIDVLLENGLEGLLYMSSLRNGAPVVSGDTLHLNDVETFPDDLESEIFEPGDLLISLRNINTILVLDGESRRVKFLSVGRVTRQHDPDFMPGDRISVFDNRNFTVAGEAGPPASRIVEIDARDGTVTTVLQGDGEEPFFTEIMGVHQRLENGNILVVPSGEGRVLEFTLDGRLAWRYDNRVETDLNMRVYVAKVLPADMDEAFFRSLKSQCKSSAQP